MRDAARSLHSVCPSLWSGTPCRDLRWRRRVFARLLPTQRHTPLRDVRCNAGAYDPVGPQHSRIHVAQSLPAIPHARKRCADESGPCARTSGSDSGNSGGPSSRCVRLTCKQHPSPYPRTPWPSSSDFRHLTPHSSSPLALAPSACVRHSLCSWRST
jgi:hypothetical protein